MKYSNIKNTTAIAVAAEKGKDPRRQGFHANIDILYKYFLLGHFRVVELLVRRGADYTARNENGYNAFIIAAQFGHVQIVQFFIFNKENKFLKGHDGWDALFVGAANGIGARQFYSISANLHMQLFAKFCLIIILNHIIRSYESRRYFVE